MSTQQTSHGAVVEATANTEQTMRPQSVPVNVYEAQGALVVIAVGAYAWKARQARRIDMLDAQKTAFEQLRGGGGRRPDE